MVFIELLKSYCLPSIPYAVEATLLSAADVRVRVRKKESTLFLNNCNKLKHIFTVF